MITSPSLLMVDHDQANQTSLAGWIAYTARHGTARLSNKRVAGGRSERSTNESTRGLSYPRGLSPSLDDADRSPTPNAHTSVCV